MFVNSFFSDASYTSDALIKSKHDSSRTIKLLRAECFPSRGTESNANFAQRKRGRRTLVCFSACFIPEQLFAPLVEENVR